RCAECWRRRRSRTWPRGRGLREGRVPRRADVDDLAGRELEELGLVACRLDRQPLPGAVHELDPDVEPEVHDSLDHDLAGRAVRLERHLEVVRPDEGVAEAVCLADEGHYELVGRLLVDGPWRADLLDPPVAHSSAGAREVPRRLLMLRIPKRTASTALS